MDESSTRLEVKLFKGDFNCAQSVLASLGQIVGLDELTCLKIASGFGGGMAYTQKTCGAVTGAVMALSTYFGYDGTNSGDAKEKTYELIHNFLIEFEEKHGSLNCFDLLQQKSLRIPEEYMEIEQRGLFDKVCLTLVTDAVDHVKSIVSSNS